MSKSCVMLPYAQSVSPAPKKKRSTVEYEQYAGGNKCNNNGDRSDCSSIACEKKYKRKTPEKLRETFAPLAPCEQQQPQHQQPSTLRLTNSTNSPSSRFPLTTSTSVSSAIDRCAQRGLAPLRLPPLHAHSFTVSPSASYPHISCARLMPKDDCFPTRENEEGPTKIIDNLYLGSQQDAVNEPMLRKLRIKYVLNLSMNCPRSDAIKDDHCFLRISVNDSYSDRLAPYFDEAYEFIQRAQREGAGALIHCLAGISRSATICISYIMRTMHMTCEEAYQFVKKRRSSISPNFNFMGQLLDYENKLRNDGILPPVKNEKKEHRSPDAEANRCQKHVNDILGQIRQRPSLVRNSISAQDLNENRKREVSASPDAPDSSDEDCSPAKAEKKDGNEKCSTPVALRASMPDISRPKSLFDGCARPSTLFPTSAEEPSTSHSSSSRSDTSQCTVVRNLTPPGNTELPSPSTQLQSLTFEKDPSPRPISKPQVTSATSTLSYSNPIFSPLSAGPSTTMSIQMHSFASSSMSNPSFMAGHREEHQKHRHPMMEAFSRFIHKSSCKSDKNAPHVTSPMQRPTSLHSQQQRLSASSPTFSSPSSGSRSSKALDSLGSTIGSTTSSSAATGTLDSVDEDIEADRASLNSSGSHHEISVQ